MEQLNNPKRTLFPTLFIGLLLTLIYPAKTQAADACCICSPGSLDQATCVTLDQSKFAAPDDCSSLPQAAKLPSGWTCDKQTLDSSKCRTVSDGGLCPKAPQSAFTYSQAPGEAAAAKTGGTPTAAGGGGTRQNVVPELNVKIPGLTFTGGAASPESSSLLAQYIAATYRYLISVAVIAATVMFVFGAFLYLLGTAIPKIQQGKRYMTDAVIGLLLVLGANLILRTINPALTSLQFLTVQEVVPQLSAEETSHTSDSSTEGPGGKMNVPALVEGIKLAQKEMGTAAQNLPDPCLVLAICQHETGFRKIWNGYPKDREKAVSGPCGLMFFMYVSTPKPGQPPPSLVERWKVRELFPDFPGATGDRRAEATAVMDYFFANDKVVGYIAARQVASNLKNFSGNEFLTVAAYGAGAGTIGCYLKSSGCKPSVGGKLSSGGSAADNCVPHCLAVTGDCSVCKADKFMLQNCSSKPDATIKGECASESNKEMLAMITDEFANYAAKVYPALAAQYCGGAKK